MEQFQANIYGYVQGVCFRYYTQDRAEKLGLKGYVKNKMNGSVEVLAQGNKPELQQLLDCLHAGPSGASISEVEVKWSQTDDIRQDFTIA